jgi:D-alanyl-D-alanine carboxypeptidase/D-alanyl-D-alanine-endopeptidase (penicillin-binding protein 4)
VSGREAAAREAGSGGRARPRAPALALGVALASCGALELAAAEPSPAALRRSIEKIVERRAFAQAFWGVEVRSLKSGRVLYARNAEKLFRPASTLKLLTTAAVLDAFSPDARLQTTLQTAGRLDAHGRILGDVFLVGGGDPNLSGRFHEGRATAVLEAMADALGALGVRRIEGRLVGHEGRFRGDRRGDDWSWGDLVWWYGAEVSALSFNDNCADLSVAPGERAGDPLLVEAQPRSRYYSVVSTAVTAAAGVAGDLSLARDAGSNVIRLGGALALGEPPRTLNVALEDPALYATTALAEVLEARGIVVASGPATSREALPPGQRVLVAHESEPMSELVRTVNKRSQNLHAEMLLRLLGERVGGEGSHEAGVEALRAFLRRLGLEAEALHDASGLSRSDLLSPHALVSLLVAMDRHPQARAFRDSLPVAGVDGSLRNRMKGSRAQGRVAAKTGTLRYANALAGYATGARGDDGVAFAAIVNHHAGGSAEAVAALDALATLLAGN